MSGALSGLKVLDFSHLLFGPFAAQMLGDLGADVIKVERHERGDLFREIPPFFNQKVGGIENPSFLAWNRNKRSLSVDMKHPDGKAILLELAEKADVILQNFRPGVIEKLGFGYDALSRNNPGLIYCSGSGYGESGPYLARPGQDLLLQGLSGLMSVTGRADMSPTPLGVSIADQLGAYHMVYGVLAALHHRNRTGRGQKIEVDLLRALLAHQMQEFVTILNTGNRFERPRSGIAHPGMPAPFGTYKTADGFLNIAMNPFPTLCEALEAPDLLRFNDPAMLFDRRDEVHAAIEAVTVQETTDHWMQRLLTFDLWCGEVVDQADVPQDPQVRHMQAFTSVAHPQIGDIQTVNVPITFSETPGAVRRHPPSVGEHTREILREMGRSEPEIDQLLQSGAVFAPVAMAGSLP
ncbi:MAG: CoA transferase [Methylobacterium sp.]|nr:CoA transferase [Methylobacterium sp.]